MQHYCTLYSMFSNLINQSSHDNCNHATRTVQVYLPPPPQMWVSCSFYPAPSSFAPSFALQRFFTSTSHTQIFVWGGDVFGHKFGCDGLRLLPTNNADPTDHLMMLRHDEQHKKRSLRDPAKLVFFALKNLLVLNV